MRVLMLGWEFPPYIAGGLGTACHGLTKALDRLGHKVIFALPRPVHHGLERSAKVLGTNSVNADDHERASDEVASRPIIEARGVGSPRLAATVAPDIQPEPTQPSPPADSFDPWKPHTREGFEHAVFLGVPATFTHAYPAFDTPRFVDLAEPTPASVLARLPDPATRDHPPPQPQSPAPQQPAHEAPAESETPKASPSLSGSNAHNYGFDLVADAERYARLVVALALRERFDVIHAHDWLTFPAGIAVAKVSGKPLVVHVHSTEFDRSGSAVNRRVLDIEKAGVHAADRVVAVSNFTRSILTRQYAVPASKIDVVHNGVADELRAAPHAPAPPRPPIVAGDKVVLFLGRITMQKGPEYFLGAAKRVLEKVPNVKFVLAGSGDLAVRMIELAAGMGIGHRVLFTGFLKGRDVDRVFDMADCFVMPSVSEPFGIAALEAIQHDVPVIVSKTSGASEVLRNVLKVDFWDVDDIASKIIAVLRYPALAQSLRAHGSAEVRAMTWDAAAQKLLSTYAHAIASAQPNELVAS